MSKNLSWSATLLLSLCLFVFSSCDNDDDENPAKPAINLKELGSGHDSPNDRTGYIGGSMHIEADIIAEGLIKQIDLEIHLEEGDYEFEKTFTDTKYVGVKNTTFHEHFSIPADAPAGDYHLHLTVTDQLGQTTTAEAELTVKEGESDHDHDH